jgi:hypothetical protein
MQIIERSKLLHLAGNLNAENQDEIALAFFRYQARYNPLYKRFLELLNCRVESIKDPARIPCLPLQFFKTDRIQTGEWTPETSFTSSSTTGQTPSTHLVRDLNLYKENARRGFSSIFGDPSGWCVLALLPSYLERTGSSLVVMADDFIQHSNFPQSGFFLHDHDSLIKVLRDCVKHQRPTLLLGVSFALLDLADQHPANLRGITIMETGGMKGRREELTRGQLHEKLKSAFQVDQIYSEYGMTELFSQAYTRGGAVFTPALTLKAYASEVNDPFCNAAPGRTGILRMIDLANLDSCCFLETEDLGKVYTDGTFEVLGRLDRAEMRGCNLMVE